MYGVGAFGEQGARHTVDILNAELSQLMAQLHCLSPIDLKHHIITA